MTVVTAARRTLLLVWMLLFGCVAAQADSRPPSWILISPAAVGMREPSLSPLLREVAPMELSRDTFDEGRAGPGQQAVAVTSILGADRWRSAGFTGYGVRVAIIDRGFEGAEELRGTGLPSNVRLRSFRADGDLNAGSEHGTLAARVVTSMAPRAELYLLNFSTPAELAALVDFVTAERIQVVSFSLSFVFVGPGNGTGAVDDVIGRSASDGAFWAVAAGNWAGQHWSGTFTDRSGNTVHEFAPGLEDDGRLYRAQDLITVALRWDNAWGAACDDYDLDLFGPDGALVRASRQVQDCHGDPVEKIEVLATRSGRYRARVIRVVGSAARRFDLVMLGTPDRGDVLDLSTAASSLLEPAEHPSVFTVGAAAAGNPMQVARFSSRGPTVDGRVKPDIIAPSGPQSFGDGSFSGTSAASPYVAAAAALLLEASPGLTPAEVPAQLRDRALDVPPAAADSESGAGLLQMGTVSGFGPLLPPGASAASFVDFTPRDSAVAVYRYRGPSGFPERFGYMLTGSRTPVAFYRLDVVRARFDAFVMRALASVDTFDVFNDGDFIFVRFQ